MSKQEIIKNYLNFLLPALEEKEEGRFYMENECYIYWIKRDIEGFGFYNTSINFMIDYINFFPFDSDWLMWNTFAYDIINKYAHDKGTMHNKLP